MRILHAIPQFPYFGGRTIIGGYSSALLELSIAQARAGDEVTIISHMPDEAGIGEIEPNVHTVEIFGKTDSSSVKHGVRFIRASARWAEEHRQDFDVVHVHSGFADYFLAASRIRTKAKLPTIYSLYCPIPTSGGRWNLPIFKGLLLRCARSVDSLTAMSQNVANSMESWGLENITVVPTAVDIERFKPRVVPSVRETLGLSNDNILILFVGNAKPQKNLTRVLDAFAEVHEKCESARLVVTTELPKSSTAVRLRMLRDKIDTLGIDKYVVQLGIIDNMPELMSSADILIAPFMDSFGPSDHFVAAIESMACGVPVVSSDVGGMSEIIESPRGVLVDPTDYKAMVHAMLLYVENKELRRTGGEDARNFVVATFDSCKTVEAYRTIYDGLLE